MSNENEVQQEAERMTGNKESARSLDGMVEAQKDALKSEVEGKEFTMPSFFIDTEKKQRVEVDVLFNKTNGKIVSISKTGLGIDFKEFDYLGHTVEWVEFTIPNYDDMSSYRQKSMIFNQQLGKAVVDPVKMRNFYLVFHLKNWSIKDATGDEMELKFEDGGALTDETLNTVVNVFPSFLDVVLSIYEKDVILN